MNAIRRILVPVDFSSASRGAIRQAVMLAEAFEAEVDVLHVWEPAPNVTPVQLGWMAGDANAFCSSLEGELRERIEAMVAEEVPDAKRVSVAIEAGFVAHTIVERLKTQPYDLVVMGTHGRRGLAHLVLGSVAERVVRSAPCPVLTTRAADVEAADKEESAVELDTPTHV